MAGEREAGDLPEPLQVAPQALRRVELDCALFSTPLDTHVKDMRDGCAATAVPCKEVAVWERDRRLEGPRFENAIDERASGRRAAESESADLARAADSHFDEGAARRLTGLDDLRIQGVSIAHMLEYTSQLRRRGQFPHRVQVADRYRLARRR